MAEVASTTDSNPALPASGFEAERAGADLARLAEIEARHDGARSASKARKHLKRGLSQSGFEVVEVETPLLPAAGAAASDREAEPVLATHLFARVEGDERDAILLVAPYDTRTTSGEAARLATTGTSGPALLLELARIDQRARRSDVASPLAWWIAMVDGDGYGIEESDTDLSVQAGFPGSEAFAIWLAGQPEARKIRLVVFVDRVGRPSIDVARDLHSNRSYREVFFAEGAARGHVAFAPDRPLSAPLAGQRAFVANGIAPVVAIIGEPLAPTAAPLDLDERGADHATRSDSLFAVGDTMAAALERIGDRLARLDAFRSDPLRGGPGEIALPGAGEATDVRADGGEPAVDPATRQTTDSDPE